MKTLNVNGLELNYVERGSGDETVVFSHSFLVDHRQFDAQIAALESRYRVIAYDHRDHGRSSRARTAYGLDDLVSDAVGVIEATGSAPCHFCGSSTGGFVGLRLAIGHRKLLRSVVLMDTSAERERWYRRLKYHVLFTALGVLGTGPVLGFAVRAMFGRTSRSDPSRAALLDEWARRIAGNDPAALQRFGRAVTARESVLEQLAHVEIPALVIVGDQDDTLPLPLSRHMAEAIRGARMEVIEGGGHLNTIECPEAVNAALLQFLGQVETTMG